MALKRKKEGKGPAVPAGNKPAISTANLELPDGFLPPAPNRNAQQKNKKRRANKNQQPADKQNSKTMVNSKTNVGSNDRALMRSKLPSSFNEPRVIINRNWAPKDSYIEAVKAFKKAGGIFRVYNLATSRQSLEKRGFRPDVSSRRPHKMELDWLKQAEPLAKKPTRDEYIFGARKAYDGTIHSQSRQLTRAPLMPRYSFKDENFSEPARELNLNEVSALEKMLLHPDLGPMIIECVFEDGLKTAHQLALSSPLIWRIIGKQTRIWNLVSGQFHTMGYNGVLLALNPEYTIGDFSKSRKSQAKGSPAVNPTEPTPFSGQVMEWEASIFQTILDMHQSFKRLRTNRWHRTEDEIIATVFPQTKEITALQREIFFAIPLIQDRRMVNTHNQFKKLTWPELFQPQICMQTTGLKSLLSTISLQRNALRVLHLQEIPLLDRRVLAMILRACPQVSMVGVYDCPLIHYGDVICLLDLLHEVNAERRGTYPEIKDFDFFPHFNRGLPYKHHFYTSTFGVSWSAGRLETRQRGFWAILLKAFLKSRAMGLGLLFSKDHAFRDYLFKLPLTPLAVASFLDAAHRYMDLEGSSKILSRMEALFDLLKPVNQGLKSREKRGHDYFSDQMGQEQCFCSSCGCVMLSEFFDDWEMARAVKTCAGCLLQVALDSEENHLRGWKKQLLDELLEGQGWTGSEHNPQAPIYHSGRSLMHSYDGPRQDPMTATNSSRLLPPLFDYKINDDSLQQLPSLSELVADNDMAQERWSRFARGGNELDVFCRTLRILREEQDPRAQQYVGERADKGAADHFDEPQRDLDPNNYWSLSLDYDMVLKCHNQLLRQGQ